MAEASLRYPPDLRAESLGQESAETIWPNVVAAMGEVAIATSDRRPRDMADEMVALTRRNAAEAGVAIKVGNKQHRRDSRQHRHG
jgi:protein-tyrosine-phosphatase